MKRRKQEPSEGLATPSEGVRSSESVRPLKIKKSVDDSLDLINLESDEEDLLPSLDLKPEPKKSLMSMSLGQYPLFTPQSDPLSESSFIFESPVKNKDKTVEIKETKETKTKETKSKEPKTKETKGKEAKKRVPKEAHPALSIFTPDEHIDQKLLEKVNVKKTDRAELMKEMKIIIPESIFEYIDYDILKQMFTDEVDDKGKRISSPSKGQDQGTVIETTKIIKIPSKSSIIRWKRYSEGRYDEKKDLFIPCEPEDQPENATVLFYMIQDFLKIEDSEIQKQVTPQTTLLLGNYHRYINEIKRKEESEYKNRVQSQQPSTSKKTSEVQEIEYRLNKLQYESNLNIICLRSGDEMVRHLVDFTYALAYSKYDRYERNPELGNIIKPKVGQDNRTTFIEMFRNFKFMTEPRAELLYSYYDSLAKIHNRFELGKKLGNDDDGRTLVPISTEEAMKRFFTSNDENEIFYS